MMNKKGFTLVELMVVIVIIGILAAVALPQMMGATDKAKVSEVPSQLKSIQNAQNAYHASTGTYGNWDAIGVENPTANSKWFNYTLNSSNTSYTATANAKVDIGSDISSGDMIADINQDGDKTTGDDVTSLLPNWNNN